VQQYGRSVLVSLRSPRHDLRLMLARVRAAAPGTVQQRVQVGDLPPYLQHVFHRVELYAQLPCD